MVNNAALVAGSSAVVSAATVTVDPVSSPASVSSGVVASSAAVLAIAVVAAETGIASALAAEVVDGATTASVSAAADNLRFVVDSGCDGVTGIAEA
uniref:Putative secreted protein n=1 Tax=Anopheles nuneztovari TaxID=30067 RepID=A0A2M3YWV0_9DIPT